MKTEIKVAGTMGGVPFYCFSDDTQEDFIFFKEDFIPLALALSKEVGAEIIEVDKFSTRNTDGNLAVVL